MDDVRMRAVKYVYSFCVHPSETWGFSKPLYEFFLATNRRIEMPMTVDEFERFRSGLGRDGFTVREAERVPYHEPEPVY